MKYFVSLIFIFGYFSLILFQIVEGIVGGQDAQPGQFKYDVAIFNDEIYICVGIILSEKHILTAAQCILFESKEFIDGSLSVIGGVYNFEKNKHYEVSAEVVTVYAPILHRFNNPGAQSSSNIMTGEVAVLKLKTKLNLRLNSLEMVKLKSSLPANRFILTDSISYVAGYGYQVATERVGILKNRYIEYNSDTIKLKYLKVRLLEYQNCRQTYFIDPSTHICAQAMQNNPKIPQGTCKGDEGSGLVIDDKALIGILIKPPINCNERESVGLYTLIFPYLKFIKNVMIDNHSDDIRVKHLTRIHHRRDFTLNGQLSQSVYNY